MSGARTPSDVVQTWTIDETAQWLTSLHTDFSRWRFFKAEGVDGKKLLGLSDYALDRLGIQAPHRKIILHAIEELKSGSRPLMFGGKQGKAKGKVKAKKQQESDEEESDPFEDDDEDSDPSEDDEESDPFENDDDDDEEEEPVGKRKAQARSSAVRTRVQKKSRPAPKKKAKAREETKTAASAAASFVVPVAASQVHSQSQRPPVLLHPGAGPKQSGYPWGLSWNKAAETDTVLVMDSNDPMVVPGLHGNTSQVRVACFDLDHTLVAPKSGKQFPQNRADWKWYLPEVPGYLRHLYANGYTLVIFSNQNGISKGKQSEASVTMKILDICKEAGVPMLAFLATHGNEYRKPSTRMWDLLVELLSQKKHGPNPGAKETPQFNASFYAGDAAGRPAGWQAGKKKDFSCSDRQFAYNVAFADSSVGVDVSGDVPVLPFFTPEELFLQLPLDKNFQWRSSDPQALLDTAADLTTKRRARGVAGIGAVDNGFTDGTGRSAVVVRAAHRGRQELIVFCGSMASGKSQWAKRHLVTPHGYVYINQDTLGTRDKCVKAAREALQQGKSVAVDNTNRDAKTRAFYVELAETQDVPCRCFHFRAPRGLVEHLNLFREKVDPTRKRLKPLIMNMFFSRFEAPSTAEGFEDVCTVDWVPDFQSERHRRLFMQYT